MSRNNKLFPVVLLLGKKEDLVGPIEEEMHDLPVQFVECNSLKELECLSIKPEIILILTQSSFFKKMKYEALESLRLKNASDAQLIILAKSSERESKFLSLVEGALSEVIYEPISTSIIQKKIISYLDLYERKSELLYAIQELEQSKKRLASDEQKIKILTNAVSEPILFVDKNLMVSFWNSEAESFFGYTKFEVINESFLRWLVAPKSHAAIKKLFVDVTNSGQGILKRNQSFAFRNKLGLELNVSVTLSYHKIGDDNFNLVFVIHDTSKERRLEKETQKVREFREENKLMRELLSHVNHELRTPLNAIVGISKTLQNHNSANLNNRQKEGINLIQKSGEQLLVMIKDLLEISRVEANKLTLNIEPFDFDKLLSQQKTQTLNLIGKKNIKFVLKRSPAIPTMIEGDLKKINQTLTNVLGNAVKYTTEGKIILSSHLIDNKLYFEVVDTGVGIPKDKLESVFEKFVRVSENDKYAPGTGLGLHITRKLVQLMNGEIKAESEKGKGTTFRFYITLPSEVKPIKLLPIQPEIEAADLKILNYSPSRKLILVIDDSIQNTFIYSILSEYDDYSVIVCNNSKKALSTATDFRPDLILLKFEMPGIHGSSIIKELQRRESRIPLIVFSEFEKFTSNLPSSILLLEEPVSLEGIYNVLQEKVAWKGQERIEGAVIVEEDSWFMLESNKREAFLEISNIEEELSFIKLCQFNPKYLIIEHIDKNSNGLSLFLKIMNNNRLNKFKKIILHHEAAPMKYLVEKVSSFKNIVLMTKREILNENFD